MFQQREHLKSLIKQSSGETQRKGRFFKYGSDTPVEVTFKEFLALDPGVARTARIVTGTSIDIDVKAPEAIECNRGEEVLSCSVTGGGRSRYLGNVLGISNFKNTRLIPGKNTIAVEPTKTGMRCVAENGMILFCIGY